MACCLMAPSHYLNQCWYIINVFCGIQQRTISQEVLMNLIGNVFGGYTLKITITSSRGCLTLDTHMVLTHAVLNLFWKTVSTKLAGPRPQADNTRDGLANEVFAGPAGLAIICENHIGSYCRDMQLTWRSCDLDISVGTRVRMASNVFVDPGKHKNIFAFSITSQNRGHRKVKSFLTKDMNLSVLYTEYHDCQRPGGTKGPGQQQPWYWPSYRGIFWSQHQMS